MSKMGRPKKDLADIKFDGWDQLDAMIIWSSEQYCADKLGMSVDSLCNKIKEKHGMTFSDYKKKKSEVVKSNLRKKQYDIAMKGNVSMLIWLGKNILGQSDKNEVNSTGEGTNITIKYERDDS